MWILTEMVANADAVEAIICGIGINLNHQEEDFLILYVIVLQAFACTIQKKSIDINFKTFN